ncbi:MAG: hypothetical protein CM15mP117_06290 [Alphaproteobacteria bacterium]|nr:MAG: hypothetical protein CM15mP117_06290 [Alphaproteobacteria bacterium]
MEEIKRLSNLRGSDVNDAKIILANEVTKLCHGAENAATAAKTASDTFNSKIMSEGLPQLNVSAEQLDTFSVFDAFVNLA